MPLIRLEIEPHDPPSARKIRRAAGIIHEGGVAGYPTDSVYAIGCAIDAKRSIERVYRAKEMTGTRKLALLCPDLSTASQFGHFSQQAFRLARQLFPGPYTIVVPASRDVPRSLLDKRRTVGIRIPGHPITLALIKALGRPLLTSSAIAPGEETALSDPDDVSEVFGAHLDLMIHGGPTGDVPSTVLAIRGDDVLLMREGAGPIEDLAIVEE
jgi:tRNA threonylcarbamoyl adenosine modification protein (Sua5/YciO/YrdC/YwlC family)